MLDELCADWAAWWATLTPDFVFLLALPFGVAVVGLAAELFARQRDGP